MASKRKIIPTHVWHKATLSPMAQGLFTTAFYPKPSAKGEQVVYFTQVDITSQQSKVIVASKLTESGIRMMTRELAMMCLIPGEKATAKITNDLNALSIKLKL